LLSNVKFTNYGVIEIGALKATTLSLYVEDWE
jgi:hypothetical protein